MTTTTQHADVPLPSGWVAPDEWEVGRIQPKEEIRAWRLIYSRDRFVTDHDACVSVRATQYSDGRLEDIEIITLGAPDSDNPLNSDQAREMAAALLEAAAELEGLGR